MKTHSVLKIKVYETLLTSTKTYTDLPEYIIKFILFTSFNAQFLYSLTICMLHYNPRHVSSINISRIVM